MTEVIVIRARTSLGLIAVAGAVRSLSKIPVFVSNSDIGEVVHDIDFTPLEILIHSRSKLSLHHSSCCKCGVCKGNRFTGFPKKGKKVW